MSEFWQLRMMTSPKNGDEKSPAQKPDASAKLPSSYYVGKEYVEDPNKINVFIKFKFRSAVIFSGIKFDRGKLHVRQLDNGEVLCTLEKVVSQKLFNVIDKPNPKEPNAFLGATSFILGYIKHYLPIINEQIQRQKYLDGHILAHTISLPEIYEVGVLDRKNPESGGVVLWPVPITGFPPSKLPPGQDAVFVRDLIDAMTLYFQYDLDDCIRKVITSLENCFLHYQLAPRPHNRWERFTSAVFKKKLKIKRLINDYVAEGHYPYIERDLKILRNNILFIYQLRNLVVHDKLRINPSQTTVCRKAIGTLLYIYQGNFVSDQQRAHIFSFYGQFISIYEQFMGYSLEVAEWREKSTKGQKGERGIIHNPDDMNKWMFGNLKITKGERKSVLSGGVEEHLPPSERI